MSKSTTIILMAVGLGGLGYFLYKKGLFVNKTITEVAKEVKNDMVDVVTPDSRKKTTVEPATKPCEVTQWDCGSNPKETILIPYDADCNTYQWKRPPCAPPWGGGFGKEMVFAPLNNL
jgi:hypothetical protein